jgi:small neutral amino acid transporter SnatA (MarC family)
MDSSHRVVPVVHALVLASATTTILITFGVAILALAVGGGAIYLSFGGDDRSSARKLLRHPLRTIFDDTPPEVDED